VTVLTGGGAELYQRAAKTGGFLTSCCIDVLTSLTFHLQPYSTQQHRHSVARWPWPPPNNSKQAVKKIICDEKLVVVKVAVSSNKVL
jgi:hypothetical protein